MLATVTRISIFVHLLHLTGLYVQKTRQILSSMRSTRGSRGAVGMQNVFADQLKGAIGQHGAKKDGSSLVNQLNAKLGLQ